MTTPEECREVWRDQLPFFANDPAAVEPMLDRVVFQPEAHHAHEMRRAARARRARGASTAPVLAIAGADDRGSRRRWPRGSPTRRRTASCCHRRRRALPVRRDARPLLAGADRLAHAHGIVNALSVSLRSSTRSSGSAVAVSAVPGLQCGPCTVTSRCARGSRLVDRDRVEQRGADGELEVERPGRRAPVVDDQRDVAVLALARQRLDLEVRPVVGLAAGAREPLGAPRSPCRAGRATGSAPSRGSGPGRAGLRRGGVNTQLVLPVPAVVQLRKPGAAMRWTRLLAGPCGPAA